MPREAPTDRRSYPRVDECIPIRIIQQDEALVTESANLSASGVYCKIHRYIPPMTKLQLTLEVPPRGLPGGRRKTVSCVGVVVRSEPSTQPGDDPSTYHIAIFFLDIATSDRQMIQEAVQQRLRRP